MILRYLLTLPRGKVTTYKALGEKFGMHPRKIARILASNKDIDKYPCYKVVYSDGRVGGYVLGIKEKIKRLKDEGIVVKNDRVFNDVIINEL